MRLVVIVLLLALPSKQDLPVHCPHSSLQGVWELSLSKTDQSKSLSCSDGSAVHVCQYGSCFDYPILGKPKFEENRKIEVELRNPNLAIAVFPDQTVQKGVWTSVYDEGFEIHLNGSAYFAFSLFHEENQGNSNEQTALGSTSVASGFRSDCSKTWPGWISRLSNPDEESWGCFVATKLDKATGDSVLPNLLQTSEATKEQREQKSPRTIPKTAYKSRLKQRKLRSLAAHQDTAAHHHHERSVYPSKTAQLEGAIKVSNVTLRRLPSWHQHVRRIREIDFDQPQIFFEEQSEFVSGINLKAKGKWFASHYQQFEGLSTQQMRRLAGSVSLPSSKFPAEISSEKATLNALLTKYGSSFDWRNVDGQNFVDEVVSQQCGDCYATATVSMINSRLRILTNNTVKAKYDWHQIVNCDPYNQGCAGGYPFLVEKFIHNYGLTHDGSCPLGIPKAMLQTGSSQTQKNVESPEVRVESYNYLGGYYGATTVEEIMKEVKSNGPVAVGIGGSLELMHYRSGVYNPTDHQPPPLYDFEPVDHAVLLIGWGFDPKTQEHHWILKNSYGHWWGEGGFFRIPMLGDARNIRSLVTAAMPVFGNEHYFNQNHLQRKEFEAKLIKKRSAEKRNEKHQDSDFNHNMETLNANPFAASTTVEPRLSLFRPSSTEPQSFSPDAGWEGTVEDIVRRATEMTMVN